MDRKQWSDVGKCAIVAAATWTAQSAISLAYSKPTDLLDYTMIVPIMLTMVVLRQLRAQGAFGHGRLSLAVAGLAAIGLITAAPCQIGFAEERDLLLPFEIVGTAALILALVVGGIAVIRTAMLPRWMGVALIAAQPSAMVLGLVFSPISPLASHGDYSGALGHGIVWWLIGLTLLGKQVPFIGSPSAPRTVEAQS